MNSPIRVLLVGDRAVARTRIRAVLDEDRSIEAVGEASDGVSAVGLAWDLEPHVLLADAMAHTIDAVDLVDGLGVRCGGRVPGVLLMADEGDTRARRALRAGAKGVVLSSVTPGQLLSAVHVVAAGYRVLLDERTLPARDDDAVPAVASFQEASAVKGTGMGLLTRREREVFRLLAQGLSNTEISVALVLSENTVKSHVQRLLDKLDLRNRVHAVIYAYRTGLMGYACPGPHARPEPEPLRPVSHPHPHSPSHSHSPSRRAGDPVPCGSRAGASA
ncbi:response regulator transcription factor [Streptomyces sp. GC420]|uniref:response regulator transcription factor n=1 Tax=Streptomyces sp. GC420 TaxID=2697568 RepID=UPI0014150F08|nr:response regulator transcription factor [Streptomyces sp. GC420]NBM16036.1 response regulator [Streptomyces sp. GC420]